MPRAVRSPASERRWYRALAGASTSSTAFWRRSSAADALVVGRAGHDPVLDRGHVGSGQTGPDVAWHVVAHDRRAGRVDLAKQVAGGRIARIDPLHHRTRHR